MEGGGSTHYFGDVFSRTAEATYETFGVKVGVTVTAGDSMMIDVSDTQFAVGKSVKKLVGGAALGAGWVGIAAETVVGVAGGKNKVKVWTPSRRGTFVSAANVADAVVAGDPLSCVAVDGRLEKGTVGTHHILDAVALTDGSAANTADVLLIG